MKTLCLTVAQSRHLMSGVVNITADFQEQLGPNQKRYIKGYLDRCHPFVGADVDGVELTEEDLLKMVDQV